jgi:hypothetical protein
VKYEKYLFDPKSKGLSRRDPDLIPNFGGINLDSFGILRGIDPGSSRDFRRYLEWLSENLHWSKETTQLERTET